MKLASITTISCLLLLAAVGLTRSQDEEARKHLLHELGGPYFISRDKVQVEMKLSDEQKQEYVSKQSNARMRAFLHNAAYGMLGDAPLDRVDVRHIALRQSAKGASGCMPESENVLKRGRQYRVRSHFDKDTDALPNGVRNSVNEANGIAHIPPPIGGVQRRARRDLATHRRNEGGSALAGAQICQPLHHRSLEAVQS